MSLERIECMEDAFGHCSCLVVEFVVLAVADFDPLQLASNLRHANRGCIKFSLF